MPRYEYRCRSCGTTFEAARPMSQSADPATCPVGHDDTVKLLSMVAVTGTTAGTAGTSAASSACACGGSCCCGG